MTAPVATPEAEPTVTEPETKPAGDPPADLKPDEQLGDAGKKALAAERSRAKALEKELAGYKKAEQDKADADKSEAEKRTAAEARATAAELRATRLEVAAEKGLTPKQAQRLNGTTREELEADADEFLKDLPDGTAPAKPAAPKPDPSQGARGEAKTRPTSLAAAVTSHYAKP